MLQALNLENAPTPVKIRSGTGSDPEDSAFAGLMAQASYASMTPRAANPDLAREDRSERQELAGQRSETAEVQTAAKPTERPANEKSPVETPSDARDPAKAAATPDRAVASKSSAAIATDASKQVTDPATKPATPLAEAEADATKALLQTQVPTASRAPLPPSVPAAAPGDLAVQTAEQATKPEAPVLALPKGAIQTPKQTSEAAKVLSLRAPKFAISSHTEITGDSKPDANLTANLSTIGVAIEVTKDPRQGLQPQEPAAAGNPFSQSVSETLGPQATKLEGQAVAAIGQLDAALKGIPQKIEPSGEESKATVELALTELPNLSKGDSWALKQTPGSSQVLQADTRKPALADQIETIGDSKVETKLAALAANQWNIKVDAQASKEPIQGLQQQVSEASTDPIAQKVPQPQAPKARKSEAQAAATIVRADMPLKGVPQEIQTPEGVSKVPGKLAFTGQVETGSDAKTGTNLPGGDVNQAKPSLNPPEFEVGHLTKAETFAPQIQIQKPPAPSVNAAAVPMAEGVKVSQTLSTAEPARPSPVFTQVEGSIRWILQNKSQGAELQLHPAALGRIVIQLRVEGTEVHARLWASEPTSLPILQDHKAFLESSLREQGLSLGSFDLYSGARGNGAHTAPQERPPAGASVALPIPEVKQEMPIETALDSAKAHRIEVFA